MEEAQLPKKTAREGIDTESLRKMYNAQIAHEKRSVKVRMINCLISLYLHYGDVSKACEQLLMSRSTFYNWKRENKTFQEAVDDIEETFLDAAESKIRQKIEDGDVACLIFYLKTKGKNRGYSEKIEVDSTVTNKSLKEYTDDELRKIASGGGED